MKLLVQQTLHAPILLLRTVRLQAASATLARTSALRTNADFGSPAVVPKNVGAVSSRSCPSALCLNPCASSGRMHELCGTPVGSCVSSSKRDSATSSRPPPVREGTALKTITDVMAAPASTCRRQRRSCRNTIAGLRRGSEIAATSFPFFLRNTTDVYEGPQVCRSRMMLLFYCTGRSSFCTADVAVERALENGIGLGGL